MSVAVDIMDPPERDAEAGFDWNDPQSVNREALRLGFIHVADCVRGTPDAGRAMRGLSLLRERSAFPLALDTIQSRFGLSDTDRDVLLLAVSDDGVLDTISDMTSRDRFGRSTVALAQRAFGPECLARLAPEAPLRRHALIRLEGRERLSSRALVLAESVNWYLQGHAGLSVDLCQIAQAIPAPALTLGRDAAVKLGALVRRAQAWDGSVRYGYTDRDPVPFLETLRAALLALDTDMLHLDATAIDAVLANDPYMAAGWLRDIRLSGAFPVIAMASSTSAAHARGFIDRLDMPHLVLSDDADVMRALSALPLSVGGTASDVDPMAAAAQQHFDLSAGQLRHAQKAVGLGLQDDLWTAARQEAGRRMGPFASSVSTRAGWDDLILPDGQKTALKHMAAFLSHRGRVESDWGFGQKSSRGLGMAALFHGPSGTGKTTAAEILVREMAVPNGGQVELFRIDVSALVSKYIGETAKNIADVFESGRKAGAALLFDEAEGLFAKRSQGSRDSLDKHSNAELGFLLQCLEDYPGVAILTTNLYHLIDEAFLRRFRFVIEFPFPDRAQRERIWQRSIPDTAPTGDLDFEALSRLSVSGGNIRSITINAAFEAASDGTPLSMRHLASAARMELMKQQKSLPESLLAEWGVA